LPLTRDEEFLAKVQKGNRIQVPRLIRWMYRLDPGEILMAEVQAGIGNYKTFYAQLNRDGRFTVPKIIVEELKVEPGHTVEVTLFYTGEAEESEEPEEDEGREADKIESLLKGLKQKSPVRRSLRLEKPKKRPTTET